MKNLIIKVNHKNAEVTIRRGLFGSRASYGKEWFVSHSLNEMIEDFVSMEVENFTEKVRKDVKEVE